MITKGPLVPEEMLEEDVMLYIPRLKEGTSSKEPSITEKITERRTIVYKTCVDFTVIKLAIEKMKKKLFVKMGVLRPKREDIQYFSIDKYYEPYIFLEGKYSIDYYRKHFFTLQVDEDAREIVILGKRFEPKIVNDSKKGAVGVTTLEAEKRFIHEKGVKLILDKAGQEVPFEKIPLAPFEEDSKKILDEFKDRLGVLQVAPDEEIEILRSKIVQRPREWDRIATEFFEVSERTLIYVPTYRITFQNARTGEKKIVKMDGVTAKILEE